MELDVTPTRRRNISISVEPVLPDTPEPHKDSVVMVHGLGGTAWQRVRNPFHSKKPWQSVHGKQAAWDEVRNMPNGFIVLHGDG